ncbi:hypothetical protein [Sphingobium sp.]|nr:hypothetical protein [Sphingobium sp.]
MRDAGYRYVTIDDGWQGKSVTPEACWSSDGNASISKLMRFVSSQAE